MRQHRRKSNLALHQPRGMVHLWPGNWNLKGWGSVIVGGQGSHRCWSFLAKESLERGVED
eukprot:766756-Hanusia_phi.AAC.1